MFIMPSTFDVFDVAMDILYLSIPETVGGGFVEVSVGLYIALSLLCIGGCLSMWFVSLTTMWIFVDGKVLSGEYASIAIHSLSKMISVLLFEDLLTLCVQYSYLDKYSTEINVLPVFNAFFMFSASLYGILTVYKVMKDTANTDRN